MNNQKNKNEKYKNSVIDLSQFPVSQKEEPTKFLSFGNLKNFWTKMNRTNRILTVIIGISILITVLLILFSLTDGIKETETGPPTPGAPSNYVPPAGEKWKEYTPPFP